MNFSIMFICRIPQLSQNNKNSKCLRTICSRKRVNVRKDSHPLWTRIQKHTISGSTPKEVDEEDNYQSDFCRLSTFGMSASGHANTRMDCVRLASIAWHQRPPTTQQTVCVADDAIRLVNCCSSQPLPVNRLTFLSFRRTDCKRIGLVVNLSPLQTHFQQIVSKERSSFSNHKEEHLNFFFKSSAFQTISSISLLLSLTQQRIQVFFNTVTFLDIFYGFFLSANDNRLN